MSLLQSFAGGDVTLEDDMTGIVTMTTTTGSREDARRIAKALVEERLAACVQIAPIESWYRWEGRVEQADELLLTIKTRVTRAEAVSARLCELHSYAVPEILTIPVSDGSPAYLAWIADEVPDA